MTYKWRLLEERKTLDILVEFDQNVSERWAFDIDLGVGMYALVVDNAPLDQDGLLSVQLLVWFSGLD